MVVISIDSTSAFVHPQNLYAWLDAHRPEQVYVGQINLLKIGTNSYAVTAPHVMTSPLLQFPFPNSEELGQWTNSADGREISFAQLRDWKKFGFSVEPVEAQAPTINAPASIKTTMFVSAEEGVRDMDMPGTLKILSSPEHIKLLGETMDPGSAFTDRLLRRAPTKPVLAMIIPEQYRRFLRGSSGAFVWQNGHPVGVFVAAYFNEGMPPVTYIEPLLDSVAVTKP
ncbi:MAG: hypothetical protein HZA80_03210 [Candidatus Taylorbacteria bacterium]|nr:hypothetical protein [Candidatus Taylorbacteria bacterium]